jgi:hypothetical protein
MSVKNSLIKIAYENPELRADLLPIIEGMDKEASPTGWAATALAILTGIGAENAHAVNRPGVAPKPRVSEVAKMNSYNAAVETSSTLQDHDLTSSDFSVIAGLLPPSIRKDIVKDVGVLEKEGLSPGRAFAAVLGEAGIALRSDVGDAKVGDKTVHYMSIVSYDDKSLNGKVIKYPAGGRGAKIIDRHTADKEVRAATR